MFRREINLSKFLLRNIFLFFLHKIQYSRKHLICPFCIFLTFKVLTLGQTRQTDRHAYNTDNTHRCLLYYYDKHRTYSFFKKYHGIVNQFLCLIVVRIIIGQRDNTLAHNTKAGSSILFSCPSLK